MVTSQGAQLFLWKRGVLTGLIWLPLAIASAQDGKVHAIAIRLQTGGQPISGFLHSVSDSAVTIIPGVGGPKRFEKALELSKPISIPISVIKKVAVARVRSGGRIFARVMLISLPYSIVYLTFLPFETVAGLVLYSVTVTTATLLTYNLLYARKYKPTEPGFTVKMQQYCLVKSGIVADWQ